MVTVSGSVPVEVLVSLDHGLSWQIAGETQPELKTSIDLTSLVKGTYTYLLKLKTSGTQGSTAIDLLNMKTWVQVAPASLPALKKGRTVFEYDIGDRYDLQTIPMLIKPNTADPKDLGKYVLKMPADYDPNRHTCRIRGEIILRLVPPRGMKISWLTVGGTFRTHQGEHARNTDNRIAYAIGRPEDFQEIYRSHVPTWVNHWRYNWDGDIALSKPADAVFVRYTANTGLNTIRACLHLLPNRTADEHMGIVHTYRIDGQLEETEKWLTGPASYVIECAAEPENVSVTLDVPHGR